MANKVVYEMRLKKPKEDCILYYGGRNISSYTIGKTTYKSAAGFGRVERAYEALDVWRKMGNRGAPASSTAFFRSQFEKMKLSGEVYSRTNATVNNFVAKGFYGGWIEQMQSGPINVPLYHYDLRNAYLWAGGQGLPETIYPYDPKNRHYMVLAYVNRVKEEIPSFWERRRARLEPLLVTDEDVVQYGMDIEILRGISWNDWNFKPDSILYELADVPLWLFKKMTQTYWGLFAARDPIIARKQVNGEIVREWKLYNRFQHLAWAQIIIGRIVRRVHMDARAGGRLVYVDSVLIDRRLDENEAVGGWRLEEEFPLGVWIKAPGVWERMPDATKRNVAHWYKHAGYACVEG